MELNEKIQELRKKKGLTQEELARHLFVSRTAVSKWESGRGYPNTDSLKAMARFFGVTVDELLSGDQLLAIAEEDTRQKQDHIRDLVFGSLDCSAAMFFFLPFFGQEADGIIRAVPLFSLTEAAPYLKAVYTAAVAAMALWGMLTLALRSCRRRFWVKQKSKLSLFLSMAGALLFTVSSQPYAAALLLIFLAIKALMLIKWP